MVIGRLQGREDYAILTVSSNADPVLRNVGLGPELSCFGRGREGGCTLDPIRVVVTTTPKPIKIIRELIADPTTLITRGSTYDNRANLAPAFLAQIVRKHEGTRLGGQELNAEILDDVPGALWHREWQHARSRR